MYHPIVDAIFESKSLNHASRYSSFSLYKKVYLTLLNFLLNLLEKGGVLLTIIEQLKPFDDSISYGGRPVAPPRKSMPKHYSCDIYRNDCWEGA